VDNVIVPIDLQRDDRRRWLVARITGSLSIEDLLQFLQTARASFELQTWPLLVDARGAASLLRPEDVERAVVLVRAAVERGESRAHVAVVADDDRLFDWMLVYEARCAEAGARVIRTFRNPLDAERWLEILSASRQLL
jgi:hypothetical protein